MNGPVNPIDNLRDIHLPVEPGFWPPAIGWWIVALLIVLLVWTVFRLCKKYYLNHRHIRAFRQSIEAVQVDGLVAAVDRQTAVSELSSAVKQLCMRTLGRTQAAQLHGDALLGVLDQLGNTTQFTNGPGKLLGAGHYQPDIDGDIGAVQKLLLDRLAKRAITKRAQRAGSDGW